MRALLISAAALSLVACSFPMKLLDNGRVHEGTYRPGPGPSMDVSVDGIAYSGKIQQNVGVGFGTGMVAGKPINTTGFTVGSGAQALMTSKDGKWIACQFSAAAGSGSGMCQDAAGKNYGLVIGN